MLGGEIADDRVRLPEHEAVVVDSRHEPGGIHPQILRRLVDAVLKAGIDALVLDPQFLGRPQHLLDVDRVGSSPDLQHSETNCLTIAAGIAGDEVTAVELPDKLRAAELVVVVDRDHAMPAPLQLLDYRGLESAVLDG